MKDRRVAIGQEPYRPIYVVWELTLACDHACAHCGSRAGKARERELNRQSSVGDGGPSVYAAAGNQRRLLDYHEQYVAKRRFGVVIASKQFFCLFS